MLAARGAGFRRAAGQWIPRSGDHRRGALEWGLVNRVFPDDALLDEAMKLAETLAQGPTVALAAMRRLYWASPHNAYEQQLDLERRCQQDAGRTQDFIAGVGAFLQKRPPGFKGK